MANCLSIILAAGEGTRMKSSIPKVLHEIAGLPMVSHVLQTVIRVGVDHCAVVVGREAARIQSAVHNMDGKVTIFEQTERLGTAHAVLTAKPLLQKKFDQILVLYGDTPLTTAETLNKMRSAMEGDCDVVVLGFRPDNNSGYGRLLMDGDRLLAIREEKDATQTEREISFCNSGIIGFKGADIVEMLEDINNDNENSEYYLTDIVEVAVKLGKKVIALEAPTEEVLGVDHRQKLAQAEGYWQEKRRNELMISGVTMQDPNSVVLSYDTIIEPDVWVGANVVFGPGSVVKTGAVIHPFCHIEGATVATGAQIGPFARLRPGAKIGQDAKVGNFCEVKKANLQTGAKINHLTYVGDADIGEGANIGAGTITCNYDGANKHMTQIGKGAFVGSNSALVAPIKIGDGAYIASGSVITDDVPDDALGVARSRQSNKSGYGAFIRKRNTILKDRYDQNKP